MHERTRAHSLLLSPVLSLRTDIANYRFPANWTDRPPANLIAVLATRLPSSSPMDNRPRTCVHTCNVGLSHEGPDSDHVSRVIQHDIRFA